METHVHKIPKNEQVARAIWLEFLRRQMTGKKQNAIQLLGKIFNRTSNIEKTL